VVRPGLSVPRNPSRGGQGRAALLGPIGSASLSPAGVLAR
jgi:hypothetical protein